MTVLTWNGGKLPRYKSFIALAPIIGNYFLRR
jgi:hypothetical protein